MRIGVSLSSTHLVDDHAEGARNMVERARVAREAGLDSLSVGDHHAMAVPYYQNVPMIGRLMSEWEPYRPIGCLFLLPLWNPVLVAEQVGTLACLTQATFLVQTGIGGGREQFAAMGGDLRRRGADLDEAIRVIKVLLAGGTADSERFGIAGASINPRPPRPVEWWIGAGSPTPIARAAREGVWYAGPDLTEERAAELLALYRDECELAGTEPKAMLRKDVIVLRDGDRATRHGDELIARGYRGMPREAVVYGGVDAAVDQLAPYREIGFDEIVARCMTVPQRDALETLELMGEVRDRLR